MSSFDDRKKGFESKFAHDEETLFKIDKKKALFIGDSEHDYQSAINSNINFCLKKNGFTNKPILYFKKSLRIKNYTDKIIL